MTGGDDRSTGGLARCERCGASLAQSDRFCSSCGAAASSLATGSGATRIRPPERSNDPVAPPTAPLPPAPPRPPSDSPRATETNGLAVASLVLGILWLAGLGSLLAIVFGVKGRSQIDASGGHQGGRGLATAGIALGVTGIGGLALLFILLLATTSSTTHPPFPTARPSGGGTTAIAPSSRAPQTTSTPPLGAVATVREYWSDIAHHDLSGAYQFTAGSSPGSGEEAKWIREMEKGGVEQVSGTFGSKLESSKQLDSGTETVGIESLRTTTRSGCTTWTGNYELTHSSGRWQIVSENLEPHSC
jgi:hypothetical protein